MNRFNRFAALRWMYNVIVPPRYRDKLNITEEMCALENALNKVIEVTNANGKALEAISQDLEDIQFGAGGYYRPVITAKDGSVTFSFVASNNSMPPIEEKTFFLKGEKGDSFYDMCVQNGFVGDETDLIIAMKGKDGAYVTGITDMGGNSTETTYRLEFSDGKGYDFIVYHGITPPMTEIVSSVIAELPKYNGEVIENE